MPTVERGLPLVHHVISELKARQPSAAKGQGKGGDVKGAKAPAPVGASRSALDALESKLMVEIPPTLRAFLSFDFYFSTLESCHGKARFGSNVEAPKPRLTSVRKLAEARTDLGWTDSRIRTKLVRLPNRPRYPWNALYLGEARRDGELLILGIEHEDTLVRFFPRYTAFDLYIAETAGLIDLSDAQRLEDLESHIALNPELGSADDGDEGETEY